MNEFPKYLIIPGEVGSGSLDGDKPEEEEGARRIEVSPLRVSGGSLTPGREESGLGADLDCCEVVGGEEETDLVGDKTGKQLTLDQVFLSIKQAVRRILFSLLTVQ